MTLGVAVWNGSEILLGIESRAVPVRVNKRLGRMPVHTEFESKLLDLQPVPHFVVLCAGGTQHWADVKDNYEPQGDIQSAVNHVQSLLEQAMRPGEEAHGLLCGFDGKNPMCFRIGRRDNPVEVIRVETRMEKGQPMFIANSYSIGQISGIEELHRSIQYAIDRPYLLEHPHVEPPVRTSSIKPQ